MNGSRAQGKTTRIQQARALMNVTLLPGTIYRHVGKRVCYYCSSALHDGCHDECVAATMRLATCMGLSNAYMVQQGLGKARYRMLCMQTGTTFETEADVWQVAAPEELE